MLIDLDGAIKSMKATQQANVKRFVLVSAIGIQNYHEENHLDWIDRSSYYSAAKYYADVWLENSDLDYTIVRPGGLTNEQGTGEVSVSEELDFEKIPREDVASAIILSLENDGTIGKAFDITSGDTAIEKAIQSF
ncbi:hypothetical protein GCM10025854_18210 [Tetragenococcus muriaticus]|nr:hypothetical protein GCM10025854_18210 [Tetragenococcus muriaticus]